MKTALTCIALIVAFAAFIFLVIKIDIKKKKYEKQIAQIEEEIKQNKEKENAKIDIKEKMETGSNSGDFDASIDIVRKLASKGN